MINLYDNDPSNHPEIHRSLTDAAEAVLTYHHQSTKYELTIVLEDTNIIQKLNREFLNNDRPTDVLSFPSNEFDPDSHLTYIGDVVISKDVAQNQAAVAGHSLMCEMQLLVIHGVLHLLGYDHLDKTDKIKMWAVQNQILEGLGCKINSYPE